MTTGRWVQALVAAVGLAAAGAAETAYEEPSFDVRLFDLRRVRLELRERQDLANELVRVAYFLSDRPGKSARALALADALVPRHSGTRVANFRLRRGFGPTEVEMVVVDELGASLLEHAARLVERSERDGEGWKALGYLVDVIEELPLESEPLKDSKTRLARLAPAVDWTGVAHRELPPGERQ